VTEAIAKKGGTVTTLEQYRSTLANLSLLAMQIDRVGEDSSRSLHARRHRSFGSDERDFSSRSFLKDSPSSEYTVANVAITLRHIETGSYAMLTYLVYHV
jgi:hypothetical protein